MSTAPRYEPHYSVSDYLQWEGEWELWNGTAVAMSPSPLGPHERAAAKLVFQIESCLQAQGCACATYAGLDWIVSDDTVVRPDVMVVCGSQPGRHLERPPDHVRLSSVWTAARTELRLFFHSIDFGRKPGGVLPRSGDQRVRSRVHS